jgi:hypothetical protein
MMIEEIEKKSNKSNDSSKDGSVEHTPVLKDIEEPDVTKGKRSGSPLFKTVAKSRDSYIKNLVKEIQT